MDNFGLRTGLLDVGERVRMAWLIRLIVSSGRLRKKRTSATGFALKG